MKLKYCVGIVGSLLFSAKALALPSHVFPSTFKWCVATSAHQIEGGNDQSDWWDFESQPGRIKNGERSGMAADHWNRVAEDVAIMRGMNVGQYRFSVEWAKLETREGVWNAQAFEHYKEELRLLREAGIEPMITLHHFTLPAWVAARGGWEWSGVDQAFQAFTAKVYEELGAGVRDWVTINEPLVTLLGGYVDGIFPPGQKREISGISEPLVGLLRGHAAAYRVLHKMAADRGASIRVGMAHHLRIFDAKNFINPLDHVAAKFLDDAANWAIPSSLESGEIKVQIPLMISLKRKIPGLAGTQDFFGVNYYSRDMVDLNVFRKDPVMRIAKPGSPQNDLGWEIYPDGFYLTLKRIARRFPQKPVIVTENGVADASDRIRGQFIREHVAQMHRAMSEGVPVESYCHWSLLDNFEWAEGFAPRFGLVEIDYSTQKRTPRPSAQVFSKIAGENGF